VASHSHNTETDRDAVRQVSQRSICYNHYLLILSVVQILTGIAFGKKLFDIDTD
jgi:hypothetical protein